MITKEQLINLVSGNLSSERKEEVLNAIKQDKNLQKDYQTIKNAWSLSSIDKKMSDRQLHNSYLRFINKRKGNSIYYNFVYKTVKYAAIFVFIFALGVLTQKLLLPNKFDWLSADAQYNEITVSNGDKAKITLSDGSEVWLNSGTTFIFPENFSAKQRNVQIDGEGFFEVKKGDTPFFVESKYGTIEVLGTSFNVRAYKTMPFQATLTEGKIRFSTENDTKDILPGQRISISETGKIEINKVNPNYDSSWKEGVLAFENEPLELVIRKLENHFNVKITLDEELAQIRFRGRIFDESLFEVMEYINKSKPITYTYNKTTKELTIKGSGE